LSANGNDDFAIYLKKLHNMLNDSDSNESLMNGINNLFIVLDENNKGNLNISYSSNDQSNNPGRRNSCRVSSALENGQSADESNIQEGEEETFNFI